MNKLYERICKAEVVIAASCFAVSCLLIFAAAIARSFSRPINWSQDLSLFLFAWSVFLSADAAFRADRLVNVDILVTRLPERWRRAMTLACYLIILAFLSAMVVYGINLAIFSRRRVFQGIPGFSYSWVALSVPVGSFLQIITVILKIKKLLATKIGEPAPGSEA